MPGGREGSWRRSPGKRGADWRPRMTLALPRPAEATMPRFPSQLAYLRDPPTMPAVWARRGVLPFNLSVKWPVLKLKSRVKMAISMTRWDLRMNAEGAGTVRPWKSAASVRLPDVACAW